MKPFLVTLIAALLVAFVIVVALRQLPSQREAVVKTQQEPAKAVNVFTGRSTNLIRICDNGNTVYLAMNTAGRMVTPAIFVVPAMMGVCE